MPWHVLQVKLAAMEAADKGKEKHEVDFLLSPTMNYSSQFIAWTSDCASGWPS
jgi:hypothetical protein